MIIYKIKKFKKKLGKNGKKNTQFVLLLNDY